MSRVDLALADLLAQQARSAELRVVLADGRVLTVSLPRCTAHVYLPPTVLAGLGEDFPFRVSAPHRGWLLVALRSEDPSTEYTVGVEGP